MIDLVYQIVKTILNKELRGNLSPDEFNKLGKQVQDMIYAGYFVDINLSKNKENRGNVGTNHANLTQQIRQKITQFQVKSDLTYDAVNNKFILPDDLYWINDNGILFNGTVVEEAQSGEFGWLSKSLATPTESFPVYEKYGKDIIIYPETIEANVSLRYLRVPKDPKWTYQVVLGTEMFDPSAGDYQDFELHPSEAFLIVIEMCSLFGINVRETEVAQYAEALKRIVEAKKQQ